MKISGNTILLTGGGSGIGRELARRWHDLGNEVIITGRRLDALEETAHGRPGIHPYALDVADAQAISDSMYWSTTPGSCATRRLPQPAILPMRKK
jgi:uncharacterized oxidoreductase